MEKARRVRVVEGEAEGVTGQIFAGHQCHHEGSDGQERVTIITDDGALLSVPESQVRDGEKKTFGFGSSK